MIAHSKDGIRWEKEERDTAIFTERNDAYTLTRNHSEPEWLLYQTHLKPWPDKPYKDNLGSYRRGISIRRSPDLTNWTEQEIIMEADDHDALSAEFYLLKVFYYADRYVGLLRIYYADPRTPYVHSDIIRSELIFSKDGIQWVRPYRYTDIGAWSFASPFEYQGKLCLVAKHKSSLSLFCTRIDGLACCRADAEGSFCTRPFVMPAAQLFVNADCRKGLISVELLDEWGSIIDNCTGSRCTFRDADKTDLPLKWGRKSTSDYAGRMVHLRFNMSQARIFSVYSIGDARLK